MAPGENEGAMPASDNASGQGSNASGEQPIPGMAESDGEQLRGVVGGDIEGKDVTVSQSVATVISARRDLCAANSGALVMAAGRDASVVRSGGSAFVAGNDMEVESGYTSVAIAGNSLRLRGIGGLLLAGNRAKVSESKVGVVISSDVRLDDNSRVLFTTPQAAAFGAAFGLVMGLVCFLLRRCRPSCCKATGK